VITSTIATALNNLGFVEGWAANETEGIVLWENDAPQPTQAELIAAGWIKPEPIAEEAPEE
jgi:hypothetical protein